MSAQEIPRGEIQVGMKVRAPEWTFGTYNESGDRMCEVEVTRIEGLWRRQPRLVRIEDAGGRQGIINVSWLRRAES